MKLKTFLVLRSAEGQPSLPVEVGEEDEGRVDEGEVDPGGNGGGKHESHPY